MTRAADRLVVEVGGSAFPLICHTHLFTYACNYFSIFIDSLIALLNLIISFSTKQSLLSTSVVGGAWKRGPRWIHTHLHSAVSPFKSRVKADRPPDSLSPDHIHSNQTTELILIYKPRSKIEIQMHVFRSLLTSENAAVSSAARHMHVAFSSQNKHSPTKQHLCSESNDTNLQKKMLPNWATSIN